MKFKNLSMCKYTLASSLILISGLLSLPDAFAQSSQADKTIQEVVVIKSIGIGLPYQVRQLMIQI